MKDLLGTYQYCPVSFILILKYSVGFEKNVFEIMLCVSD